MWRLDILIIIWGKQWDVAWDYLSMFEKNCNVINELKIQERSGEDNHDENAGGNSNQLQHVLIYVITGFQYLELIFQEGTKDS